MGRWLNLPSRSASSCAALFIAGLLATRSAEPCGVLGSREGRRPSLAYEQVLLVHDPTTEQEHFIRSVTFRTEDHPFGFVVPTPSRPTVAEVKASPFPALREGYPFDPPPPGNRGSGSGYGQLGGGTRVLEETKVGSFTAFVLAADDDNALRKWLADNQLVSTTETDAWLSHYVRLGFYYGALRYEPTSARAKAAALSGRERHFRSETIRISFKTPLPYYPYLEPQLPVEKALTERLLDLWVISPSAVVPVATREAARERAWIRPMREGQRFDKAGARLAKAVGSEIEGLLPAGELVLQTFQDQKVSRAGFGDILFVPLEKSGVRARREALESLFGLLDPELVKDTPR